MSVTVRLECPVCGQDIEATVRREGGDWVPYGSTHVRTPAYLVAEMDNCPANCVWTDKQMAAMEDQACSSAEDAYDYDPREDWNEDDPRYER